MSAASSGGVLSRVNLTASTNCCDGLLDGLPDLGAGEHDRLGKTGDEVATPDLGGRLVGVRPGGPDRHLHLLGGALAEHEVVFLLDPGDDRLVELVTADADALGDDDAAERDDGDLGGATTDVDHHRSGRLVDRQTHPDGGRHRLLDGVGAAGSGVIGRFFDGAPLNGGDAGGHTDHDAGPGGEAPVVDLVDEVAQHLLGDVEVGDDPVAQRPDRLDVRRRASDHPLGFHADLERSVVAGVDGDHRRLVEHDAHGRARTPACWRCQGRWPCHDRRGRRGCSWEDLRGESDHCTFGAEFRSGRARFGTLRSPEEEPELPLGARRRVGAVDDVFGDDEAEVAADRARRQPRPDWSDP